MSGYAVVDSGTTTTRLRLWQDGRQVWSGSRAAGARDTAVDGTTDKVRAALRDLLDLARKERPEPLDAIICSGMITSNMGLFEVPHLPAPAGPDDLARGVVQRSFPELGEVPLSFIPGVKTLPSTLDLSTLAAGDVLRGEEVEIAGMRATLGIEEDAVFVHIGSHHKAIDVDAEGRILGSRSAITGELLGAVVGNTILKSSVTELDELQLDVAAALAGAKATKDHGFGRALFLVRVGEQLGGFSKERMTSYLLGVLAALDLPLLAGSFNSDQQRIIVYGLGAFPEILSAMFAADGRTNATVVDKETADAAAAIGAVRLFERSRELGVAQ